MSDGESSEGQRPTLAEEKAQMREEWNKLQEEGAKMSDEEKQDEFNKQTQTTEAVKPEEDKPSIRDKFKNAGGRSGLTNPWDKK